MAPESMMAVWSSWLRGIWALRGGGLWLILGEVSYDLKCVILFKIFPMSVAPPCHKLIFQLGGRLLALLASSRNMSGLRKPYFLQCGQVLGLPLYGIIPLVALS